MTKKRRAGANGRQIREWEDLLGRMQRWVSVNDAGDRDDASEMRRRKTKDRSSRMRLRGLACRSWGELNQRGSNHCRSGEGGRGLRRGKARRQCQCEAEGGKGHKREVWRNVAAERKVRSVEADEDCERWTR